jgi:hypothetical protein
MDTLDVTRFALRQEVCAGCFRSPAPLAGAPATEPRPCEADCDIFYYLPRLAAMVRRFGGEPPCGYALAVLNLPCRACGGAGRDEPESCGDRRPLSRYAGAAMALIETMNRSAAASIG